MDLGDKVLMLGEVSQDVLGDVEAAAINVFLGEEEEEYIEEFVKTARVNMNAIMAVAHDGKI